MKGSDGFTAHIILEIGLLLGDFGARESGGLTHSKSTADAVAAHVNRGVGGNGKSTPTQSTKICSVFAKVIRG